MFSIRRDRPETAMKAQLDSLMEAAGDAVFRLDRQGEIIGFSRRARELIGTDAELAGLPLAALVAPVDHVALKSAIEEAIRAARPTRVNLRMKTAQNSLWMELQLSAYAGESQDTELLAVGRDITSQQETEERLRHMATHDALTGLPNRSLLSDRIRMAMAQSRRTGKGFAVLALDLDGFKKVNDALGHPVGDALLQVAAARLMDTLRDIDTLARVGGDEFVAVVPGAVSEAELQIIARRMISAMQQPFEIQGHTLYIGTSIGVAVFPEHGDSEVKLLAHADTAMYRAKETGKARCVIYSAEKFTQPEHDVSLEAAMFQAVRDGEFLLHYQPIVDARSRQIMGFEALMRWMRPGTGMVSPAQFIPMAESNGLINLLGGWALKAACVQIKRFEEIIGRPLYVSVNVSPRQFRNDQFIDVMNDAIRLSGLNGEQLLLEITEGILMSDPEHAESLLNAITARKVRIAIDDFGTGYSSLAYLKRFPIATLKIDRAFIKDLPRSVKDAAICNVVISLASHLDVNTVAEGVENQEQLDYLAKQGCGLVQGFFTGRPLPPQEIISLLEAEQAAREAASGETVDEPA
ncbi:PAS domain S-box-containing protein/diguanylate cyclase (GGDEF) domain-containing protein [Noviherbaspirillum humi]|uniref:PAS domain S-box-containing protein/diguanylate cyclase (GGDEF) domain-containing protein n=2 Tax=Noviherbaspirillum humi TaxID=1688639 RepID=A0A239JEF6_9BURK|nr:PAS domain S-box-containing protein/diguanylate cyclase (GGDEF) domain-containing protein [Noviherbaspirillum humi]